MKKYALITGATSGIGYSFAKILAKKNYNLILLGRNVEQLEKIKIEFKNEYNIEVRSYNCDLSVMNDLEGTWIKIDKEYEKIDVFINNAGAGFNGRFNEISWEQHEKIIDLNMKAFTRLLYLVSSKMLIYNEGKILNVASTGAFQAGPMIGVYYATKAYVLSLSVATREELSEKNIIVSALCPGATKTNFCERAGKKDLDVAMSPDDVAMIGYRGLIRKKGIITPGIINKFAIILSKFVPYIFMARIVKKIQSKVIE